MRVGVEQDGFSCVAQEWRETVADYDTALPGKRTRTELYSLDDGRSYVGLRLEPTPPSARVCACVALGQHVSCMNSA
jgi:hypothetical protein